MTMKFLVPLVISLGFLSCNAQDKQGKPIEYAPNYKTTILTFDDFKIHTLTNDTIFRECGYELIIEPNDTLKQYEFAITGGKLLRSRDNRFKIVIQPNQQNLILKVTDNNNKTTEVPFICPMLPLPKLHIEEYSIDSVKISLVQPNKRLKDLMPRDNRYGFIQNDTLVKVITIKKEELNSKKLQAMRINYRNEKFEVDIQK